MKSTHKNFLKGEMNKQRLAYKAHRRRRRAHKTNTNSGERNGGKETIEATIGNVQNSMLSKDATMTLEAVESRDGETASKLKLRV